MQTFLINLARRPDRLAAMTAQARELGLTLTAIAALDAREAPDAVLARWFAAAGPLGAIPRGDQCCTLSHRQAWQALVESGASHAAVLEDDVGLKPAAGSLLRDAGWIGGDVDLVKLEHYGPPGQGVLLSDFRPVTRDGLAGLRLARLRSRHTGAAAYILSRRAAQRLLAVDRFDLPVDHLLFNPNNSPLFEALRPWQLLPPVARQVQGSGAPSDIEGWRTGMRRFGWRFVRREAIRFAYDLKLLPAQVALAASGRAKFVRLSP